MCRIQDTHQPPFPHDPNPVTHGNKLRHVGGYHNYNLLFLCQFFNQLIDFLSGSHIHALGGLVKNIYISVLQKPAGNNHLLLVAAAQVAYLLLLAEYLYLKLLYAFIHNSFFLSQIQKKGIVVF